MTALPELFYLCHICHKMPKGFRFDPKVKGLRGQNVRFFCSMRCMEMNNVIDPTPNEQKALLDSGKLAGEYLEYLKKSDIADLTPKEYDTLIEVVVTGYLESMQTLAAKQMGYERDVPWT